MFVYPTRIPFLGLFLCALVGVLLGNSFAALWVHFFCGFGFLGGLSLWRGKTVFLLLAVVGFFAAWTGSRLGTDVGLQLARALPAKGVYANLRVRVDSDPAQFKFGVQERIRFRASVLEVNRQKAEFRALVEVPAFESDSGREDFDPSSGRWSLPIQYGDVLSLRGELVRPNAPLNPGEFNYPEYLRHQRIYLLARVWSAAAVQRTATNQGHPLVFWALQIRHAIQPYLIETVEDDPEIKSLISGILFGDRTGLPPERLEELQDTGTLHLLVIDGLKVTLFAGIGWMTSRLLQMPRRWSAALVIPAICLYCSATGLSAASLRAMLMAILAVAGVTIERPTVLLNVLSFAGFSLLLFDPEQLFQLGFQLSFTTVYAIAWFTRPLAEWLHRPFAKDPWIPFQVLNGFQRGFERASKHVCELTALSTVCWLATLPFSIFLFHRISITNVPANMLTVPIGSLMLVLGAISICLHPLLHSVSVALNNTNWLLGKLFWFLVASAAHIPGGGWNLGWSMAQEQAVVALAAGRSNTVHIHSETGDYLLNPGSLSKYRRIVEPYLRETGVNRLVRVGALREDRDHVEAFTSLVQRFNCAARWPTAMAPRTYDLGSDFQLNLKPARAGTSAWITLGPYHLLFLEDVSPHDVPAPDARSDVVFVRSIRDNSLPRLRQYHPALLVATQKSASLSQQSISPPLYVLASQGALTCTLRGDTLLIRGWDGFQLVLRNRSR
jgi:ComEC/Rec2-related protein